MTVNERFEKIINELFSGNKRAFSKAIGVSPSVIENVVGVRNGKPSFDVVDKLLCAIANINAEWLITGKGEMLKSAPEDTPAKTEPEHTYNSIIREKDAEINLLKQIIKDQHIELKNANEEIGVLKYQLKIFQTSHKDTATPYYTGYPSPLSMESPAEYPKPEEKNS